MSNAERVAASENFNSVISEELQQKIAENVRLHEALDGVEKRYEDRIDSLQARVHELESVAAKKARAERADDARLKVRGFRSVRNFWQILFSARKGFCKLIGRIYFATHCFNRNLASF